MPIWVRHEADRRAMILKSFGILGQTLSKGIAAFGYVGALLVESLYWVAFGRGRQQPVKLAPVAAQMMDVGVRAIPIVGILSLAVGISLAIQMIYGLKEFGAESQVVGPVAKGIVREFGPLITGILVAGRTASSLAARIGSMVVSQEVDAMRVIGIMPVRYLAAPPLLALIIMMPVLTIISIVAAIVGSGLYSIVHLDLSMHAYLVTSMNSLNLADVSQGLSKSVVFGMIIALVGVSSGFSVTGGAEGVGRTTTKSVVISISCLVITNMIFTFYLNR